METHGESKFLIPGAIVVAGALIAGAVYMGGKTPSSGSTGVNVADAAVSIPAPSTQDHLRGNPNAPVTIIEYSDTECPFCKAFHSTLKQIMTDYSGQVNWVYRQFPIPQLHQRAMNEAEATECVASLNGNDAFWAYLDNIFQTTNSNDSLDPTLLPKMATSVGVNAANFNTCLASGRFAKKIEDSIKEAIKAGARGTPYSVIINKNGDQQIVNGAEPYDSVKAKIDSLLE